MTVIAGASLFSGVLLAGDTRCTYILRDGREVVVDHLQKLLDLGGTVGLGYSGNVLVAGDLTLAAVRQVARWQGTNRRHPMSILGWLPRLFASRFDRVAPRVPHPDVSFAVATVLRGRPNIIDRAKVIALMERFRLGQLAYQRNWLPGVLMRVLMAPAEATRVALADAPLGVLAVMSSPYFRPHYYAPLSAVAIGSGAGAIEQIDREADWVFAGDVGNIYVETQGLIQAVRHHLERNAVPSVGGLFCSMKVSQDGCRSMGFSMQMAGGVRIELAMNNRGRIEQRNLTTNRTIELRYPWEIAGRAPALDERFDDLDLIERRMAARQNELGG
jgi:hypothetical protein